MQIIILLYIHVNVLNNLKDNLPHKELNKEISVEEQLEQICKLISEDKFETNDARCEAYQERSRLKKELKQF